MKIANVNKNGAKHQQTNLTNIGSQIITFSIFKKGISFQEKLIFLWH